MIGIMLVGDVRDDVGRGMKGRSGGGIVSP